MKISDFSLSVVGDDTIISVFVDSSAFNERLWFSVPNKFSKGLCTTRLDGFLVGLLFPAIQAGEDIHVDGAVSEKLLFNINNYIIPLFCAFSPSSKRINVTTNSVSSEIFDCKNVGTGFSAGIDSFCTIYDRMELETSASYKVNSFLFLNVGSHGVGTTDELLLNSREKFKNRYEYLKQFPDSIKMDFIPIDSNLHSFHSCGHQKTHTLTSASGILIFQNYFSRYYYASSGVNYSGMLSNADKYKNVDIGAYCDPILLPLLSTESLELVSDGITYLRSQKIKQIVGYEPVKKYLNVCVSGDDTYENCSICSKCCRTLMTLESLGVLDEFSHLFDVEKYRKKMAFRYECSQVLNYKKNPFAKDNIDLAKNVGRSLPILPLAMVVTYYFSVKNTVRSCIFKMLKKIIGFMPNGAR